ncbi:MAG: ATP synthase F1 subunit gamma [Planctomycetota bacterium]|jgi:F-type H+-transporting ATPase subunit gamma|nr:ATP synthase F1 subunit gamma [Planctomycetota bacterium]
MQTQDIKRRIRSVKSTRQITSAMKFVATAKLRSAQKRMQSMRPYAEAVEYLMKSMAGDLTDEGHPVFQRRLVIRRAAYVVVAGDRGLCGGFNATILKAIIEYVGARKETEPLFFVIGKQTIARFRKTRYKIVRAYHDVFEKLSYVLAGEICDKLMTMFSSDGEDRIDEAYVVYNEFASMLTQRPVIRKLLPLDLNEPAAAGKKPPGPAAGMRDDQILEEIVLEEAPDDIFDEDEAEEEMLAEQGEEEALAETPPPRLIYEFYPEMGETADKLAARFVATELYRGMLDSYAAELAARMNAMDNAAANADEMISNLTLDLNRARQAGITLDLLDIVGGANALG